MKYALFAEMALSRDLPEYGLRRGDVVRLIEDCRCPGDREGYSIEICNAVGDTIAVTAVEETALQPLQSDEIFTIRRMASAAAITEARPGRDTNTLKQERAVGPRLIARIALASVVLTLGSATLAAQQLPAIGPAEPPYHIESSAPIAIVGGTLIDATGAPPRTGQTVLIQGGKITQVGPSAQVRIPTGAEVIDAADMTVMPGLISSNQHVQLNPLYPAPAVDLPLEELKARWNRNFADMPRKAFIYLMQGITTMRQTSGPLAQLRPLKMQIDGGVIPGPRILFGGALFNSPQKFAARTAATPPDAIAWLRRDFAFYVLDDIDKDTDRLLGADINFWKFTLSDAKFNGSNDFTDEQIRFIIDKAHKAGKSVDIHANSTQEGFARLLRFDFDSLEHPFEANFLIDDATIEGFARKGIIVDTLARVRLTIPEHLADPDRFDQTDYIMSMDPDQYRLLLHYRDKMLYMKRHPDGPALALYDKFGVHGAVVDAAAGSYREQIRRMDVVHENERRFIRHKVKFAMGTDSGSFFNFLQDAPAATEMGYMVKMGMTPMEAIQAATRNGAELARMADKLGTIEAGKIADVIVVAGDPLKSMEAMKRVAFVIKDGIRFK